MRYRILVSETAGFEIGDELKTYGAGPNYEDHFTIVEIDYDANILYVEDVE